MRAGGHHELAAELERAWSADYELARERFQARGGDLAESVCAATPSGRPPPPMQCCRCWRLDAGVRLQVQIGIAAHRARFGEGSAGGSGCPSARTRPIWSRSSPRPACAARALSSPTASVSARPGTCVRSSASRGSCSCRSTAPRSRSCGATAAIPRTALYRDYHRHTVHHHNPWANDGSAYEHDARARARARPRSRFRRAHDRSPARRAGARAFRGAGWRFARSTPSCSATGGMRASPGCEAVLEECSRQGLELVRLDDALERASRAGGG